MNVENSYLTVYSNNSHIAIISDDYPDRYYLLLGHRISALSSVTIR